MPPSSIRSRCRYLPGLAVFFFLLPSTAKAHRDDYIDETFVYGTLKDGEVELEGWAEVRLDPEHHARGWYTAAFEYGITSRWMTDGAAQFTRRHNGLDFGRLRLETRYRFAEEGSWPLDVAVSAEYEHEAALDGGRNAENVLTPRLILSRDILSDFNTTLNLDFPLHVSGDGDWSIAYALGLRYPAEGLMRVGLELKGHPKEHTGSLFPQVWFDLPREITIKIGTAFGLTDRSDRFVARLAVEAGF